MTFRELLSADYARRKMQNPRYSLRAYARFLEVDQSALSQLLRGRRRLTGRVIGHLGRRLHVPASIINEASVAENAAAILAVVNDPTFRQDSRWIASKLGIRLDDVNVGLTRLLESGRLVMVSRQAWYRGDA